MTRCVEPELLDELPPDDPGAIHSRNDLLRLNGWMGNDRIMAKALRCAAGREHHLELLELGSGDGRFLLSVARRLSSSWPRVNALLIDIQALLTSETKAGLESLGWKPRVLKADVLVGLAEPGQPRPDIILANLFLHHFTDSNLRRLLALAKLRASVFVAVEPRRSLFALAMSRCIALIGCNHVTRHDAKASVKAGFNDKELSKLWGGDSNWLLYERRSGLFSHLFVARKLMPSNKT